MISFSSTHAAIQTQKLLEGTYRYITMPTLRCISMSCGISLKVDPKDVPKIRALLAQSNLGEEQYRFYLIKKEKGHITAEPL